MSGLYLFCFTPTGYCPGPDLAGIGAHSVSCFTVPGLTVWAEEVETAPRVSAEAIRRHDAVVRAAWKLAPACLPVRFGQWLPGLEPLEERLEEQRAELERALARVEGADEYGIRISDPPNSTKPTQREHARPTTGRAYLEWVREKVRTQDVHHQLGDDVSTELEAWLAGSIRAQRSDRLAPGQGLVSVSHLVEREKAGEYHAKLEQFRAAHPLVEMRTTGPWPPYSFTP